MEFPKQIYVGMSESDGELYLCASLDIETLDADEYPDVGVYKLVKAGTIEVTKTFVPTSVTK